jgi:hypothetical protein
MLELSVDEQTQQQSGIWTYRANSNMPVTSSINSTFKMNKP